jgi:hypothetical protein
MEPLELTFAQKFELEKALRAIDSCENVKELQELAKYLTKGWMAQKAAAIWLMQQTLPTQQYDGK